MSEVAAPGSRRGARAVLCAAAALAGIAAVLAVASREPARRRTVIAAPRATAGVAALPAPVAAVTEPVSRANESLTGAGVEPPVAWPWPPPVPTTSVRRGDAPPASPPTHVAPPSIEGDEWRERVAAELGRAVIDSGVVQAGAGHEHVESAEGAGPETRAPVLPLTSAAVGGAVGGEGSEGWDGGAFWFGPRGLVRMTEDQR